MKQVFRNLTVLFLPLLSSFSHAHPGHDHSHWLSNVSHGLLLAAIFISVAAVLKLLARNKAAAQQSKREV